MTNTKEALDNVLQGKWVDKEEDDLRELQAMHTITELEKAAELLKDEEIKAHYNDIDLDYIRELAQTIINRVAPCKEKYKLPEEDEVQKAFDEMFEFFNK